MNGTSAHTVLLLDLERLYDHLKTLRQFFFLPKPASSGDRDVSATY
jgi:hypothetical protein